MPNWNSNQILVQGKGKAVKQFIQENFKTHKYDGDNFIYELDFEQFDPTPINEETGEIIDDWYNWRLQHWGCKWSPIGQDQVISLGVEVDGEETIYYDLYANKEDKTFSEEFVNNLDENINMKLELQCYCETPWGPPEGIFIQWYEKYKDTGLEIRLKFYEPGCEVLGELWFSGDDFCEEYVDYNNRKVWIEYLLNEGWEDKGWFIEECSDMIREMHNENEADLIIPKVEEMIMQASLSDAATLIADIMDKYYKWLNEPKEGEESESSEK